MPDYSQPLAAASGRAATDWGSVEGGTSVDLRAAAQLSRGFNLDLGIMGLASLDAALSKFLVAEVTGEAHAQASLRAQVQVPMNLFKEIGVAVRLEAIAELAAGVEASLGLSIGDFVALVEQSPGMSGLPASLFRLFLEHVELRAGLYAKAALSAQAFAHLVVTGTAIENTALRLRPGFNIVASMGAGLKAGAGFRFFVNFGISDFRGLFGRSADLIVDDAVATATPLIPDAGVRALLDAARPAAKIGLRLAYELGDLLATSNPTRDTAGAQMVALRASQVILEEAQRFLLEALAELSVAQVRDFLDQRKLSNAWRQASAQRQGLADLIRARPARPFDGSAAAATFWSEFITKSIALASALGGSNDPGFTQGAAVGWAASMLVATAAKRVTEAGARASLIGVPPAQVRASFEGDLPSQPPSSIAQTIRARLQTMGRPQSGALRAEHLLTFLADAAVIDLLRAKIPAVAEFLAVFASVGGPLGTTAPAAAAALLSNVGTLGNVDNRATLRALSDAARALFDDLVETRLAPPLRQSLSSQTDALMMFDEVIIPSMRFTVRTALEQALAWDSSAPPTDQLTEALSGVVMRVFGRTLVASADVLMAAAQREMGRILNEVADQVDAPNGPLTALAGRLPGGMMAEDAAELIADGLRVGAEVFGPLPDATRANLRRLLFEVVDMLPPDADERIFTDLARGDFMPNGPAMESLAAELATIAIDRFVLFCEKFLLRLAARLLEEFLEFFAAAAALVAEWANAVVVAIQQIAERLAQLVSEIAQLVEEVAEAFADVGERLLEGLADLRTSSARNKFRDELVDDVIDTAESLLKDHWVYKLVPSDYKNGAKSSMKSALKTVLKNDIVDGVIDAIAEVADALDDLLDDIRAVNPDHALAPQIAEILLDRIEEAVEDLFGGDDIRIDLGFDVTWPYYDAWAGKWKTARHRVDLPDIVIDLDPVLDAVRDVAGGIGAFEDAVAAAAAKLATAFQKEKVLADAEEEQAGLETEQTELAVHAEETQTLTRGATILEPVPAQMVDRPARIVIRLDGATASMLDTGPGLPPRVMVLLNGAELDLKDFDVEVVEPESGDTPFRGIESSLGRLRPIAGTRTSLTPTLRSTRAAEDGLARGLARGLAHREGSTSRSDRIGPAGADLGTFARGGSGRDPLRAESAPTGVAMRGMRTPRIGSSARTGRGARAGSGRTGGLVRDVGKSGSPRLDGPRDDGQPSFTIPGSTGRGLGKALPPSALLPTAAAVGGLVISRTLLPRDLRDGINTLVVAVVAPSREPVRQSVPFMAAQAASVAPAPAPPVTNRPGRDGKAKPIGRRRRTKREGLLALPPAGTPTLPTRGGLKADDLKPKPALPTPLGAKSARKRANAERTARVKALKVDPLRSAAKRSKAIADAPRRTAPTVYAPRLPMPTPALSTPPGVTPPPVPAPGPAPPRATPRPAGPRPRPTSPPDEGRPQ